MINKRLMHLMGESGRYIIKNVFWQWCILLSSIVSAIVSVKLISDFDFKTISIMDVGYFIIIAVSLFTRFFASRMAAAASCMSGKEVKKVLRTGLYKKLVGLGASYHEKVPTAEALQVAVDGIEQLEVYFGSYLPQLFYSILAPLTLFIVLSFYSFRASLILLVCVPMIPVSIVAVQSIAKRLLNKYWGIYTGLGDHFLENLQGLSILKLYGRELQRGVQMDEEAERFRKITMKVLMMQLNSIIIMDIIAYGGAALGMAVCLIELKNGRIDFFSFLTLVFLSADFFIPMRLLGSYFHVAMNGMAALDRLFAIMDLPSDGSAGKDIAVNNFVSSFKMENVSFSYKGSNEDKVLDGFSMEIPRKGMVSLTGLSGCGKSTVAGLLSGRYKGYDGSIRLSGTELSDISEKSLMQAVTLVRHDSYIFNTSIRDNLLAAAPYASDKRLYEVIDFEKPGRSMQMGMMPAKLTHTLLNIGLSLSKSQQKPLIYDPFAGSGTTGFLANYFAYDFLGSDLKLTFANQNKPWWLASKWSKPDQIFDFFLHDATKSFENPELFAGKTPIIITEGWL